MSVTVLQFFFVALGGAIGALCRFSLSLIIVPQLGKFPVATFSANILGCFVMGLLFVVVAEKALLPPVWRSFLMVGFLGALTTFSSFSIEAFNLWLAEYQLLALTYVLATVLGSLLAVAAGYYLAHVITH